MTIGPLFKLWCLMLAATLIVVAISVRWLDVPIAMAFLGNSNRMGGLGRGLSSPVLVSGNMAVIIALAIARLVRGDLPEFGKALFVASCASLFAYAANDHVLKFIFGRENPLVLFQGVPPHVFNFFQGDEHSSFPSGHMAMAAAFAVAMMRLQPRTLLPLAILLCIGAALLVIGDWHFVGDIIAGVFVGATAGLVAGELWMEHVRKHTLA